MEKVRKGKWMVSLILSLFLVLTCFGATAFAAKEGIKSIEVNCSVPSEGHRLDSIVVTVENKDILRDLEASDFTLSGQAYGWSSDKAAGFKTETTHDFTADIASIKVSNTTLTLYISNFTEKYFYVDDFTVTCDKTDALTFTKADVTKESTPVADDFTKMEVRGENGEPNFIYNWFVPEDTSVKQPLILALHGSGDQENTLANRVVVSWAEEKAQQKHPAYIMAPVFMDQDPAALEATLRQAEKEIERLIQTGKIDPDRIYVTGKSMGGGNTVKIASMYPDLFAAALPLCPSAKNLDDTDITVLKDMPIWFVQATNDKSVPIEGTRDMVETLTEAGSYKVKFMEYSPEQMTARGILPDKHHDVEIISLEDERYADWLFAQSKKAPSDEIDYIKVNTAVLAGGQKIDTIEVYYSDSEKAENLTKEDFTLNGTSYTWGADAKNGYRSDTNHAFTATVSEVLVDGNKVTLSITDFPEKYFYVDSFQVTCTDDTLSFTKDGVRDTTTAVADEFAQYSKDAGAAFDYNIFVPQDIEDPVPLVLALHGSGDQENLLANKVAVAWADEKNQADRKAIVLAPVYKNQEVEALGEVSDQAVELIEKLIAVGLVDNNRVYVTGKSMGGMNTDRVFMKYPDLFAAAMPLCGGFPEDTKSMVSAIADKPIYILQGDGDPAGDGLLLPGSRELYKKLVQLGNEQALYHEFTKAEMDEAGIGYHDIEILAMEDTSFMQWLFAQTKA